MFYDVFKMLCEKKGVSCNRAAMDIGLSNSTPTKWKKTGANPDGKTISKISNYFGVSSDYLLGFSMDSSIDMAEYEISRLKKELKVAKDGEKEDIADALSIVQESYKDMIFARQMDSQMKANKKNENRDTSVRINVYGSVPAGIPVEAIEDIVDWEEIPSSMTTCGQEYIGLRVRGDSMYPKYMDGDTVIIHLQPDCESGQDAVVYINGYDATLKKVIKKQDCIILQPLNPSYEPRVCSYNDEDEPVKILGIVVEIRRKV